MSSKFNNEKSSQLLSGVMEMINNLELSLDSVRSLVTSAIELQEPLRSLNVLEPLAVAKLALRIRRRRDAIFSDQLGASDIFGEAAWDMLLDLFVSHSENKRVSVSSLCIASSVPATTALRHIRHLVDYGLIHREPDETDNRRVYLCLAKETEAAIAAILTGIGFP